MLHKLMYFLACSFLELMHVQWTVKWTLSFNIVSFSFLVFSSESMCFVLSILDYVLAVLK